MIGSQKKILIIDDDTAIRSMVQLQLSKAGYEVIEASNGIDGLNRALSEKPALILLDYLMPEMDGAHVFQELVTNPRYQAVKNTPVIIVTAKDTDQSSRTRFIEGGVSAYLHKPFGWQELVNVIENVFILHEVKVRNQLLQDELMQTTQYLESVLDATPVGIIATNPEGVIQRVNSYVFQTLQQSADEWAGKSILKIPFFQQTELHQFLTDLIVQHDRQVGPRFIQATNEFRRLALNVNGVPVRKDEAMRGFIITIQDVTETERRQHELDILSEIGTFMHSTLDLDTLLHVTLTAITAGCALGFSRAMIFLLNENEKMLECRMGVGPANAAEAARIWGELSKEYISLTEFLRKYGLAPHPPEDYFHQLVSKIRVPLSNLDEHFARVIFQKEAIRVRCVSHEKSAACLDEFRLLEIDEFVAVPMIAQDRVIGMVVADNKFSNYPMDESMIDLLKVFANQAGLAVERAGTYEKLAREKQRLEKAYHELQQTQNRLIHAERLATIGKMAAQVAHEIRNPLVTIGGFARQIEKAVDRPELSRKVYQFAHIIASEVGRLEAILKNVLDYSKVSQPQPSLNNVNKLIDELVLHLSLRDEVQSKSIVIHKQLDEGIPDSYFDYQQIKQVVLNVCQNAIHAMKNQGTLTIKTRMINESMLEIGIQDTGCGIPAKALDEIFEPFYTTRHDGTGLGLSISRKIVHNHGGDIHVASEVGKGTTVSICLKLFSVEADFISQGATFNSA